MKEAHTVINSDRGPKRQKLNQSDFLASSEGLLLLSCSVVSNSFATPWTVACQAPLSMGFSKQEYWRGLPFPSPGDLPCLGIEPRSPALQADALLTELHRREATAIRSTRMKPCSPLLEKACTTMKTWHSPKIINLKKEK